MNPAALNHDGHVSTAEKVAVAGAGVLVLIGTVLAGAYAMGLFGVCGG